MCQKERTILRRGISAYDDLGMTLALRERDVSGSERHGDSRL
jgi:hypothetical protein